MAFDASNPHASGMALTFDDEFNSLSASADGIQDGTTWTNHLWYEPAGTHADVQNGVLNLYSDGPSNNLTTVNAAQEGFSQKYGFFEARIWVPGGSGTWPAFWLISTDHARDANLPASELDILEGQGAHPNGYYGTLHRDSSHSGDQQNLNNWIDAGTNISQGWHDYGVLWDEHSNNVTFYLDDKPVLTVPKFDTTDSSPMSVIFGNGIGNMDGANPVDGATPNPSMMKVDWVHVYQFADMNPVAVADPSGGSTGVSDAPGDTTGSAGSGSSTPPTTTGPDSLTIHVSGDQWQGDPQFTVLVDGHQVGAAQDVTASHDAGQWQDITINGDFANAHQVQIAFGNDAFGGTHDQDRNVYVGSITLDGHQYQGTTAANTAAGGYEAMEPNAGVMISNGTLTFDLADSSSNGSSDAPGDTTGSAGSGSSTPPTTTGPDSLTIHVSGDQWQGDPQFTVLVDGHQVGAAQDVTASHDAGQWQDITINGDFANAHHVQIAFGNDAYGGTHAEDRNVYVGSITLDGHQYQGTSGVDTAAAGYEAIDPNAAVMVTNGVLTFDVSGASSTGTSIPGMGSSTPVDPTTPATGATTPVADAQGVQTFSDGHGHDLFVLHSASNTGATISDFHPGEDVLDLTPVLHAIGYTGQDPVADHVLQLTSDPSGGTDVMIDPQGVDPSHGQTLVTLANVTPQDLSHSIWH